MNAASVTYGHNARPIGLSMPKIHFTKPRTALAAALAGTVASALLMGCTSELPSGLLSGSSTGGPDTTTAASSSGHGSTSASGSGSTGAGGSSMQPATYTISLDTTTPQVDLNAKVDVAVTIDPMGYVGPVTLTVDNLAIPSGVTSSFANDVLTLDGSSMASTTLTLSTLTSAPPVDVPFTVTATVPAGAKTQNATLTVRPTITIIIPKNVNGLAGTAANPYKQAFGDYPIMITAPANISAAKPVNVHFYNDDDVAHEVHAGQGAAGFPHSQGSIDPHTLDVTPRPVNAADTYDFYLHDQGPNPLTIGRVIIQ